VKPFAILGVVVVGAILLVAGLRLTDHPASATPPPVATTPSATPLSHAQFVRAANGICRRSNRQGKALFKQKPQSLRMLRREIRIAVPLADREAAALRALVPPPPDAATWRRLIDHLGVELRDVHAMLHAAETRQWRRMVVVARQLDVQGKRDDPALRKLGLTVCAKD
jgi:hypothetical protein